MLKIVRQLAEIRKKKGVTQVEIAHKLGIPQSSVTRVETGKVDVKLSRFIELARMLDVEVILVPKNKAALLENLLNEQSEKGFPAIDGATYTEQFKLLAALGYPKVETIGRSIEEQNDIVSKLKTYWSKQKKSDKLRRPKIEESYTKKNSESAHKKDD